MKKNKPYTVTLYPMLDYKKINKPYVVWIYKKARVFVQLFIILVFIATISFQQYRISNKNKLIQEYREINKKLIKQCLLQDSILQMIFIEEK